MNALDTAASTLGTQQAIGAILHIDQKLLYGGSVRCGSAGCISFSPDEQTSRCESEAGTQGHEGHAEKGQEMKLYWVRYERHGQFAAKFVHATSKKKARKAVRGHCLEMCRIS